MTRSTSEVNPDKALAYLRALWPDPPAGYLLLWLSEGKRSLWFPAANPVAVAAAAVEHGTRTDVYLGCGLSPAPFGPNHRCKAADIIAIPGLWADEDIRGPAHKKKALPPTHADALALVNSMPLPPSIILESGHGLQPWWLLKEPWVFASDGDRAAAADLVKGWQSHLARLAKERGWKVDSTGDLARVLRLPGTINHKLRDEPVTVTIDFPENIRRYDPSDLRDALPLADADTPASVFLGNAVGPAAEPPPPTTAAGLDDQEIICRASEAANGDKFRRLWAGDTSGYSSPSEADLALCSILAYWTDGDRDCVERLFGQSELGKRAKWTGRADYRKMTIDKALSAGPSGNGKAPDSAHCTRDPVHLTDRGNAIRLARQRRLDLRHCHPWRKWLVWTGNRWHEDDTATVTQFAKLMLVSLYRWAVTKAQEIGTDLERCIEEKTTHENEG
jgi:hypothetical protein